ncbi:MAG: D-alanine--D-alanine ligase [Candidatus Thermochlorobacter sp.]
MAHLAIIHNSVPDRHSLSHDLKSELGLLQVAEGVAEALREHHHVSLLRFTGDVILLGEHLQALKPDAAFNLFEGAYGFSKSEVFVPITLDLLQIPYTGSPAKTLETCVQKSLTKKILLRCSVPTPRFQVFRIGAAIEPELSFPIFVKPECEDASLGISNDSVVYTQSQLEKQVETIWQKFSQPALCEEFIDGREFNVAILGDSDYEQILGHPFAPKVLPISEISFAAMPAHYPRIVSYNAKWEQGSVEYQATQPICPASLDLKLELELKQLALRAFNALGCRDYARIDFRYSNDGKLYVIDVNPNPDISPDAGLARSAQAAGYDYKRLIQTIASFALKRTSPLRED